LAERIIKMAEQQSSHRIEMESTVIRSDINRSMAGLACGFLVALTFAVVGGWAIHENHDWAGATICTVSLVSLVGVFIYGTVTRRNEREEKAKLMAGQKQ
jgi:uncharacterized membrane protein